MSRVMRVNVGVWMQGRSYIITSKVVMYDLQVLIYRVCGACSTTFCGPHRRVPQTLVFTVQPVDHQAVTYDLHALVYFNR
eukprot:6490266-Amphidinium_carterae.1